MHHVDPNNRLITGALGLCEIPVSINFQKMMSPRDPLDLRIEARCPIENHKETIDLNVKRMLELDIPVKTIVVITHDTEFFLNNQPVLEFITSYLKNITIMNRGLGTL